MLLLLLLVFSLLLVDAQDLPDACNVQTVRSELRLEELQERTRTKCVVRQCTAMDARSVQEALKWIVTQEGSFLDGVLVRTYQYAYIFEH